MTDLAFIDTSAYQHPGGAAIDWNAVKASGVSGVYVKLTEGGALDPWGKRDVVDAAAAGLHVGVYHFSRPDLNSASAEAAAFNAARKGLPCDLPPALDTETQPITLLWNQAFVNLVGDGCIGYTFRSALATLAFLPSSRIWIAWPNGTRGDYLGLQWGYGPVPGIQGTVDLDWFDPSIIPTPAVHFTGGNMFAVRSDGSGGDLMYKRSDGTLWTVFIASNGVPIDDHQVDAGQIDAVLGSGWTGPVLTVVVRGTDGAAYVIRYDTSAQKWSGYGSPLGGVQPAPIAPEGPAGPEGPTGPPGTTQPFSATITPH